ncbi:hypothetical protein A4H97_20080 [Niastella yeongjuensis]|uniref:Uncharacterized protein n=1 Tax=Niastella yeongjuensis TaxID=354355 RepID=A0A1V9FC81_9BACT|nr:hypothetical protein [Niastella yeongjuensis]OQP55891.1 hypothetical protein A4H97_20080 [Niastella yeongjuensis]SEP27560.1 hypothetical protein SAMN05660816_05059 [Niastella yeongjuensis]
MRKSRMKKIKTYGYKKKSVIVPRAKKRKKNWCVDKEKYEGFIPRHVIDRHEGRRKRKAARAAGKPSPLRVVK